MRNAWSFIGCCAFALLAGCETGQYAGQPSGTGPFDSQGNYREDWVDKPSKWGRRGSSQASGQPVVQPPVASRNEPSGSLLVAPPEPVQPSTLSKGPKPTSHAVASTERTPATTHTASIKPKSKTSSAVASHSTTKSKSSPAVASRTTKSKSTASTKSKKSSGGTRVTVGPGDSLWKYAQRYHTSVDAIKKANNLDSDMLRDGKKLVIPGH